MKEHTITVWLGSQPSLVRSNFHCPFCGNTCAEIHGDVHTMVYGDVAQELATRGVVVMCKNHQCKSKVVFVDTVEEYEDWRAPHRHN